MLSAASVATDPTSPNAINLLTMIAMLDMATAERLANLALACLHREYPNKLGHHMLNSDEDVKPPRELTPAFYGCYDWHSAVHGHWMLARLARTFPEASFATRARHALARNLTEANLRREADYVAGEGRASFERPYGLAWLLQLSSETESWDNPEARNWSQWLHPLTEIVVERLQGWLGKLSHPVRSGEHSQSAFSLGLILDYARAGPRDKFQSMLESKILRFFANDRNGPIGYEPSGEDFLSPCLAEADVMRRVLPPLDFSRWLTEFLPGISRDGKNWLPPVDVPDRKDPKLAHLDGLNLSRAWMLQGIISGLPGGDPRITALQRSVGEHASAGLNSVTGQYYEGGHWIGTFAVYLLTNQR